MRLVQIAVGVFAAYIRLENGAEALVGIYTEKPTANLHEVLGVSREE